MGRSQPIKAQREDALSGGNSRCKDLKAGKGEVCSRGCGSAKVLLKELMCLAMRTEPVVGVGKAQGRGTGCMRSESPW